MATIAAGPAFRLLGAKALGEHQDYHTAKMPSVNTGLLDGELAWRQHDGGHEDQSNMKHFLKQLFEPLQVTFSKNDSNGATKVLVFVGFL